MPKTDKIDLKPVVEALKTIVSKDKEKKAKAEAVKADADAKEKGKGKPLTDKQRIDVIWEYLGLDE